MTVMGKLRWLISFLSLLFFLSIWREAPAQAQQAARLCIQTTGANGALVCSDSWASLPLVGLTNSATQVKGSAGLLGEVYCYNPNATVAYIQLFDSTTANVTVGTTVPIMALGIPATQASGLGPTPIGVRFYNGLQAAATTTAEGGSAPSTALNCDVTYN